VEELLRVAVMMEMSMEVESGKWKGVVGSRRIISGRVFRDGLSCLSVFLKMRQQNMFTA